MSNSQGQHQMPAHDRGRAQQIAAALHGLGCDDPQGWAESEVSEGIPQLARYRFLRSVWPETIDVWEDGISSLPAARRAIDSGADRQDITRLARAVAYETAFAMLSLVSAGEPTGDLPAWALVEIDPEGRPTGRRLDGLGEDLLGLDPSSREGGDLWM